MSIKKHLSGIGIVPQALVDGYVRYLRLEKSVTENTLDAYLNDLQKLLNYYADEGIDFRRVSLEQLSCFSALLRETGVSSLFMRRKGFFHSLQRICNATALAAMPRAVKTIIGTEQVLTT